MKVRPGYIYIDREGLGLGLGVRITGVVRMAYPL
jgi:hypothetical protein